MFRIILDMLEVAFNFPISERDYHDIIYCIGEYAKARTNENISIEHELLREKGWPISYDICKVCERIRFAIVFHREDNNEIRNYLREFAKEICHVNQ